MGTYSAINAWNEIFARIFEGCERQENVSPKWLVNPTTKRRLKLDRYYTDLGIAIRFVGLQAKGQKRQNQWEELENQQRDQTRDELCRLNGVQLVVVNSYGEALKQFDGFIRVLTRARRVMAQSDQSDEHKSEWMPFLNEAQLKAISLRSLLAKNPDQMMANLAESWRDRESAILAQLTRESTIAASQKGPPSRAKAPAYKLDQRVKHERFGDGVITELSGKGEDATVSVLFDAENQRTLLISLVQDKMHIVEV